MQSTYSRPIVQENLDTWERWLIEQLANIYMVRQTRVLSPMVYPYTPTMEVAWDVAVIKARLLGEMWRGKELPDHARGNEMQAALARIRDEFMDIGIPVDERQHHDENSYYDDLSDVFFEEYAKEEEEY
jgi:hypothetical protein